MHIDDRDLRELEQDQRPEANLVITGHMPSDSIGMNRVLDAIDELLNVGMVKECGGDFYELTESGKRAIAKR